MIRTGMEEPEKENSMGKTENSSAVKSFAAYKTETRGKRKMKTPWQFYALLAIKNLARYKRRTMITASAIAFGVAIFALTASVLDGFMAENDRNMVIYETGNAAITGPRYWDERQQFPLDITVEDADEVLASLESAGFTAAPRTAFRGELIVYYDPFPEDGSIHLGFYGLDPQKDRRVFGLADSVIKGRFLEPGEDGILMGNWLANRIGAEVGYPVTVMTRTRDGFYQLMDLEIVGIIETPNPYVDRHTIYLPLDTADFYLEMRGAVTSIHISLPETVPGTADVTPVREKIGAELEARSLELLSYADMTHELAETMELSENMSYMILMLLAVIAIVGISNTMLMAVLERKREIGMMRALGVRNGEIKTMFMFEAAGIGILGSFLGIVLGIVFVWFVVNYGINYDPIMGDIDMDFRFSGVLYGVWNFRVMVMAALFATLLSGVVAIIPTRRMLHQGVSDALRQN